VHLFTLSFELLLGVWLLSSYQRRAALIALLSAFLVFTIVNSLAVYFGSVSCGCLGNLKTSPVNMLIFDLVALVFLAVVTARSSINVADCSQFAYFAVNAVISISVMSLVIVYLYGSSSAMMSKFRANAIYIENREVDFGELSRSTTTEKLVRVINNSGRTFRLIGGSSDCSCTLLDSLPLEIPDGESRQFKIFLNAPEQEGMFVKQVSLWTDLPNYQALPLRLYGRTIHP
jgi:Protein of unknown function (DUF1573)